MCDAAIVQTSSAIEAVRNLMSVIWEASPPSDQAIGAALDHLLDAYHDVPLSGPSETNAEPPDVDAEAVYARLAERFPDYGFYFTADPLAALDQVLMTSDAIDDLADITRDLREVLWRCENIGVEDAHWCLQLYYFHWSLHARGLGSFLHARQFG